MKLQLIREGSKGALVLVWEEFLRDEQCYLAEADGFFDAATTKATQLFQTKYGLDPDGSVGNKTWGQALQLGLHVLAETEGDDCEGIGWPPPPTFSTPGLVFRERLFGHIAFRPTPTPLNPEAIEITNDFAKHVVVIEVPQLKLVPGIMVGGTRLEGSGSKSGNVSLHEKVAQPMLDLWAKWESAGLLDRILTWAGMWSPRFIRGSRTTLSNHAYGTAFDINAPWNGLRKLPALVGQKGCVRELVPHANALGWYWGGHFTRKDGMHFEYVGR